MSDPAGYIRQIKSIDDTLKRLNAETKSLRKQKKVSQERLYSWMIKRNVEEYEGFKIEKLAPKPKARRKKEKDKREDALRLFGEVGINDPDAFWESFKATQKALPEEGENED